MLTRLAIVVAMTFAMVVFTASEALACKSSGSRHNGGIDFGVKCPESVGGGVTGTGDGPVVLVAGGGVGKSPESAYDRCMRQNNSNFVCANLPLVGPPARPAPAPGAPVQPDVAQLAQEARGQINFTAPRIGLSPVPPNPAIVNLQTWLWLEGGSWSPRQGSVTAGNTTVTAKAEPVSVRWDMGEGSTLCQGPGRKWVPGLGQGATSSCGFTYRHTSNNQPGDTYRVLATVHYKASWTCEGDCSRAGGDLGLIDAPTATTDLKVTERQTVVTYP